MDRPLGLLGDERLARRAAGGDKRAFAAIYRRYQEDLYRFSLAIIGNSQDAQDALQNTMVKALLALPGEKRDVKLKPWLYRVAHNEAINVIRTRRETAELDPDAVVSGEEISASVEARERLRALLADLRELPERQRAALVMRELAGFDFTEIGAVFDTTAAVARQTVYEARLGLRAMEEGREMSCEEVKQVISAADGRRLRGRDVSAHLRGCEDCRRFRDSILERRSDLASIAPLPALASAGLLHAVLGGAGGSGGGALAGAGTAGTIAGKALATSTVAKGLAALAIVAAGVATADRTGLIETPIPTGAHKSNSSATQRVSGSSEASPDSGTVTSRSGTGSQGDAAKQGGDSTAGGNTGHGHGTSGGDGTDGSGGTPGASGELPPSSSHGQETAASHGGGRANSHSHGGSQSKGGENGKAGAKGKGHPHESSSNPPHEGHPRHPAPGGSAAPSDPSHPAISHKPPAAIGPDNEPEAPLQPPKQHSNQGGAEGERPTS